MEKIKLIDQLNFYLKNINTPITYIKYNNENIKIENIDDFLYMDFYKNYDIFSRFLGEASYYQKYFDIKKFQEPNSSKEIKNFIILIATFCKKIRNDYWELPFFKFLINMVKNSNFKIDIVMDTAYHNMSRSSRIIGVKINDENIDNYLVTSLTNNDDNKSFNEMIKNYENSKIYDEKRNILHMIYREYFQKIEPVIKKNIPKEKRITHKSDNPDLSKKQIILSQIRYSYDSAKSIANQFDLHHRWIYKNWNKEEDSEFIYRMWDLFLSNLTFLLNTMNEIDEYENHNNSK